MCRAWFEPLARLPVTAEGDETSQALPLSGSPLQCSMSCPVNVVAEAAEDLAGRIIKARSPRRMPGPAGIRAPP